MKRKNEIILAGDCKMKRKAAVVCCSDGRKTPEREKLELTVKHLEEMGISVCLSDHLFSEKPSCETLRPKERAAELMRFFSDSAITDIFDISGGDLANGILPYLDYNAISESGACFYGYSDLTTLINAIYAKTGKSSVLYQVKNIAGDNADIQKKRLSEYLCGQSKELTDFRYEFVNGTEMSGVLVGGNIRCFLKLAGTEYMPDPSGKILLLEAFGKVARRAKAHLIGHLADVDGPALPQQLSCPCHTHVADILLGRLACNLHHLAIELAASVARGVRQVVNQEVGIR